MELKAMSKKIQKLFNASTIDDLRIALLDCCLSNKKDVFEKYEDIVEDLNQDWIQKLYQFFCANREELKQDYTPKSMAKLLAKMVYFEEAKTVYDGCCGTGALSIALWELNPNLKFYMEEIDNSVIPFLLFNCCIRNMECEIINGDILKGVEYKRYILSKGEKYSTVKIGSYSDIPLVDIAVSNPPFNIDFDDLNNPKYAKYNHLQKGNTNTAFIINLLEKTVFFGTCGIILPSGYISSQQKKDLNMRKYLIENNLLDSCIMCPGDFFESTGVNTSILYLDKEKQTEDFVLLDASNRCHKWIRKQNGFNHTANRVYEKSFNFFNDEDIEQIYEFVNRNYFKNDEEYLFCKEDFNNIYSYSQGVYIKNDKLIDLTYSEKDRILWEKQVNHKLEIKRISLKGCKSSNDASIENIQDALFDNGGLLFMNNESYENYIKRRKERKQ